MSWRCVEINVTNGVDMNLAPVVFIEDEPRKSHIMKDTCTRRNITDEIHNQIRRHVLAIRSRSLFKYVARKVL
ncbi:unannotated protein [freshwater metagenome]|uniref:Unannotated protein n=1 Tax=freshwater metagenome TaxID=449393 RepID=A0A6J6F564_9ZZZZ